MSRKESPEHALRQATMWRRLADQCRLCGDHDLERDARMLARQHLQRARLQQGERPSQAEHRDARPRQEATHKTRNGVGKGWWAV